MEITIVYGKRDANQRDIKAALESIGVRVWDSADARRGFPDLVCGGIHRQTMQSQIILIEVKSENGTLTPDELRFHQEWDGLPVYIVKNETEALALFGVDSSGEEVYS